jgi:hypothetical protein
VNGARGAWALALLACSAAPPSSASPPDAGSEGATDTDSGAAPGACAATPRPPPTATQSFQSLTAKLVTQLGAPAPTAPVTVCGFDLCITGQVDASGAAHVANAASAPPLLGPALKIGDGLAFAELAYPLPDEPVLDVGTTVAIALADPSRGASLAPGASATAGDVTVVVAPGAEITFDAITYPPDERGLRAAPIPLASPPLAIPASARIELAYALAPQGTTFCPPASLDVANVPAWPAGTAVEVLVHGVDLAQRWAPYAGWAVVATASVSDDGARIRSDPGSGLPVLGAIGLRHK